MRFTWNYLTHRWTGLIDTPVQHHMEVWDGASGSADRCSSPSFNWGPKVGSHISASRENLCQGERRVEPAAQEEQDCFCSGCGTLHQLLTSHGCCRVHENFLNQSSHILWTWMVYRSVLCGILLEVHQEYSVSPSLLLVIQSLDTWQLGWLSWQPVEPISGGCWTIPELLFVTHSVHNLYRQSHWVWPVSGCDQRQRVSSLDGLRSHLYSL